MKLQFTPPAVADVESILSHLSGISPAAAERVGKRIEQVLGGLLENPYLGRRTDNRRIRYVNTVPFRYLIFYEATDSSIRVIAVRHGARNPTGMPAKPL